MPAINVYGSSLSFDARGAGETIVALHPTASDRRHWTSLTEYMQGNYCVFTPDLPGHGKSDFWAGRQRTSIADEARMIFELIDRWEEPVHLVGHGHGAALALKIAMRHPQWVRSLTLIDPTVIHVLAKGSGGEQKMYAEFKAIAGNVNAAIAEGNPVAAMQTFVDFWNGQGTWQGTGQELRGRLIEMLPAVVSNLASALNETWPLGAVGLLNCPVKLVRGSASPQLVHAVTDRLQQALPRVTLETIAGAGHQLVLTHPHIVDPLVAAHVAENAATASVVRFAQAA